MSPIGLWQIADLGPDRLRSANVDLESDLETWIERDPTLLQSGLTIVARQLVNPAGRLDLLGLDPQGRFVIIEIKRGDVTRTTITQAIDYASWISTAPIEELSAKIDAYLRSRGIGSTLERLLEDRLATDDATDGNYREVEILVVGTGRDAGLERIVDFLSGCGNLSVTTVAFDVFTTRSGDRILTRALTEADRDAPAKSGGAGSTVETMLKRADAAGQGQVFRTVYDAAIEVGLHPRPYKRSIMYAPPRNRTRCLLVVWTDPSGDRLRAYVAPAAFAEFYGFDEERVKAELLGGGELRLDPESAGALAGGIRRLFSSDGDD